MSLRNLTVSLVALAVLFVASPAAAERPNKVFAGRIMLSPKRFPAQAKSLAAFNAQIKKQSKTSFFEDKEKKTWKIHFAAFLRAPLDDVEYLVKLYELQGRAQQLISSFEQFTDERGQSSLISSMTLDRKSVGVNKEILITVENKGKILASSRFKLLGQGETYSGKVDFSEEEAAKGTND